MKKILEKILRWCRNPIPASPAQASKAVSPKVLPQNMEVALAELIAKYPHLGKILKQVEGDKDFQSQLLNLAKALEDPDKNRLLRDLLDREKKKYDAVPAALLAEGRYAIEGQRLTSAFRRPQETVVSYIAFILI